MQKEKKPGLAVIIKFQITPGREVNAIVCIFFMKLNLMPIRAK